ncbi:YgjV family protein [Pseudoalteromonas marina]|uniref:YgjV family protein n=1 Tax=Pseudoalteromonas marina TaxID=267375 RepID=A0ABT9FCD0_9GAMM|nr:YgjV family protein [Pseudoalteromonas marina]MDP2564445.1 YgjV family protein [Pseudoalteromonas marina]
MEHFGFVFVLANLFGFVSTCLFLYSDIQTDDKRLDFFYTLGNVSFIFHLFLMASFVPAITVILAVLRNVVIARYDKLFVRNFFVIVFLSVFFYAVFTVSDWWNALPALCSLLMTFGFLYTKANALTFVMVVCSVLWLIVGVCIDSYYVIFLELVSILLLFYRFLRVNRGVVFDGR